MSQLSEKEWDSLQSQIATAKRRSLPYAFTEQGVAMLSSVLNSDKAVEASIQIMPEIGSCSLLQEQHERLD